MSSKLGISRLVVVLVFLFNISTVINPSSAALRACTASEKATLTKLQRSALTLNDSYSRAKLEYQKAQQNYSNNLAAGSSTGAARAKVEMQRHQNTMNTIERELGKIDSSRNAITSKCNSNSTAKNTSKKQACTNAEKNQLANLSNEYGQYQYYVEEYKLAIEDEKINYQDAVSWGKFPDAARAQINIQKYSQEIQKIFTQMAFIEREFKEINSACTGSGISLR
jgi:hypothetical protein